MSGIPGIPRIPSLGDGGTSSVKLGSLKRRLKPVLIIGLSSAGGRGDISATSRLLLKGLSGNLNVQIACGVVGLDGKPIRPDQYPAADMGTIQVTPVNNFPENQGKLYLRPAFQDPTSTDGANHPLPQNLPYGYEFSTRADEVEIDIVIPESGEAASAWQGTNISGNIFCQVTVEYDGQWWDVEAVRLALGQVTLNGQDNNDIINTGGGG
jgi:hypothetical protein